MSQDSRIGIRFILLLSLGFYLSSFAFASHSSELPVPDGLSTDIKFWEYIFSEVSADECVLHDPENLELIYSKTSLRGLSKRQKKFKIQAEKLKVRQNLLELASLKEDGAEKFSVWEESILNALPRKKLSQSFAAELANRIRCQQGVKEGFRASLERSKKYLPMIRQELRRRSLPLDLAYLPHLESGFNPMAHSKVGARGLWQLMPSLARQGMVVNKRRDDRINPYVATRFAVRVLEENFQRVRSWPLALTGYNYGINGMARAVRNLGTNDYMKIREQHNARTFGFASRNFYPSFIAARNLARKYETLP